MSRVISLAREPQVADRIMSRMQELDISIAALGRAIGKDSANIHRWFRDKGRTEPSAESLKKVAVVLRCEVSDLTGREEEPKPAAMKQAEALLFDETLRPASIWSSVGLPALIEDILRDHIYDVIKVAAKIGLEITVRMK